MSPDFKIVVIQLIFEIRFKTFCKVGSGFNMDTYEKLQFVLLAFF